MYESYKSIHERVAGLKTLSLTIPGKNSHQSMMRMFAEESVKLNVMVDSHGFWHTCNTCHVFQNRLTCMDEPKLLPTTLWMNMQPKYSDSVGQVLPTQMIGMSSLRDGYFLCGLLACSEHEVCSKASCKTSSCIELSILSIDSI